MMSVKQTVGQDPNKITALYERLSRDDDQVGDSNSIVNQKKYLESYAEQKGYTNIVHYTDDGWSGGNFERPAWKRLIADIEAGKVAHVIVKDMSRAGRDYLQTGFYTEVFFRGQRGPEQQRGWAVVEYQERMVVTRFEPQAAHRYPCKRRIGQAYHQLRYLRLQEDAG